MSNFEQLHPALQHHVVNSLGWRELRPFQDAVIPRILAGEHLIVLAPTAGGKTEAAFFPTISRMLTEGWPALSALYVCPIKALLNNLDHRLQRYCRLVGRRSALWHGDVAQTRRAQILRDAPDCLLTTPESLEVMLVSARIDARGLFGNLRVVIVDEIHAFAGDDRGWHLLSVLERISRLAGREIQRIGLSATVGNPPALIDWLAGSCRGRRGVFLPLGQRPGDADVTLDYTGSLENAAIVISRLHRGEKRLVFVDSRSRAEQLGAELRQLETTALVTHSSLSQEQRRQAEEAFASRENCVIVATSALELGVDVGDLDRVIQIDAPPTVSSFLQRMGRTGRRAGAARNCLFLATRDEALVQAAGLVDLWAGGYVEPVVPPAEPYHVLAQQLMALALQQRGIGRRGWLDWIAGVPAFAAMPPGEIERLVDWMLATEILSCDEGILWLGRQGEDAYGRRNFLELFSVFMSPPLFTVLHGRRELGSVDETSFLGKQDAPRILLLGGRGWRVNHIDWQRRHAYVEPSDQKGRSRWKGEGRPFGRHLCQAIKRVLAGDDERQWWSRRARRQIARVREEFPWLEAEGSAVVARGGEQEMEWWTFAGAGANATLANELVGLSGAAVASDSLALRFESRLAPGEFEEALHCLRANDPAAMHPGVDEEAVKGLKFSACLPVEMAVRTLERRLGDSQAVAAALAEPVRFITL